MNLGRRFPLLNLHKIIDITCPAMRFDKSSRDVLLYVKSRVVKLRPGRREVGGGLRCVVADRTQGKLKPRGEAEETPGTSEVTRGFFICSDDKTPLKSCRYINRTASVAQSLYTFLPNRKCILLY